MNWGGSSNNNVTKPISELGNYSNNTSCKPARTYLQPVPAGVKLDTPPRKELLRDVLVNALPVCHPHDNQTSIRRELFYRQSLKVAIVECPVSGIHKLTYRWCSETKTCYCIYPGKRKCINWWSPLVTLWSTIHQKSSAIGCKDISTHKISQFTTCSNSLWQYQILGTTSITYNIHIVFDILSVHALISMHPLF